MIKILVATSATVLAADKEEWKKRAVYQLLTDRFAKTQDDTQPCGDLTNYCGGTFKGIENHLDYIQELGFDAIWISPIPENMDGNYHGYAAKNWEKVNPFFGTDDELKAMVKAAHDRDMLVMVDVVANHVGCVGTDYSQIYPLNQAEHYHDPCDIQDWGN